MNYKKLRESLYDVAIVLIPPSLLLFCTTNSSVSEVIYSAVLSIIDEINKLK